MSSRLKILLMILAGLLILSYGALLSTRGQGGQYRKSSVTVDSQKSPDSDHLDRHNSKGGYNPNLLKDSLEDK